MITIETLISLWGDEFFRDAYALAQAMFGPDAGADEILCAAIATLKAESECKKCRSIKNVHCTKITEIPQ